MILTMLALIMINSVGPFHPAVREGTDNWNRDRRAVGATRQARTGSGPSLPPPSTEPARLPRFPGVVGNGWPGPSITTPIAPATSTGPVLADKCGAQEHEPERRRGRPAHQAEHEQRPADQLGGPHPSPTNTGAGIPGSGDIRLSEGGRPMSVSFCHPWTAMTVPTTTRRITDASGARRWTAATPVMMEGLTGISRLPARFPREIDR